MKTALKLLVLGCLPLLAGCPVFQSQQTPVRQLRIADPDTKNHYWLYVPSYYSADRAWPCVITLHGTHGFDDSDAQIREWKALAEQYGFIVAAPDLDSPQGILPVFESLRKKDLRRDEQAILSCKRYLVKNYKIDSRAVLLTGFSAGGYPMYDTGLRHPEEFSALAARACNSDIDIFESIELTDKARQLPIIIIHGRDDPGPIGKQSWAAFEWLRKHGFKKAMHYKMTGGHIRQPQVALQHWQETLPKEARMQP